MLKNIVIASLSIPLLILAIFSGVGLVMLASDLIRGSEYNHGWFGIIYAGLIYSYFSLLVSSIPVIVVGLPISLIAKKYNRLNGRIILAGAGMLGALFLSISSVIFFNSFNEELICWAILIGALGGLLNGYVFFRCLKT